ncbi:type I polyketide synthase [Allosediminivita pacifica]|uniref:Acyl transferase domain-containing protein n=1 Tax=Allosediminivita pacifica TaxID=1267769 RepID=A0A2T6B7F3_9RHOB|nr:type I polyketide synthase [Allosediminivita pacifica]PTX51968.1 acyl transferase domain-containing protein [Allosediminivita pacifica]GGA98259.1 hypothetical protein GCM10011324_05640 [Allosediminivita pacifica]
MNTPDPAIAANQSQLSPLKRALIALEVAEAENRRLREAARAPIAIVGIGCRVPGADGPEAFWELLDAGIDATGPVPAGRWDHEAFYDPDPDREGHISTLRGGFIDRIDEFDAKLFGISLREARSMDPQQRLFLQTAWEALEHAGIAPDTLQGSATGVFVGATSSDYTYLQVASRDRALLDAHFTSGIAHSVLSGRLSYLLGLQGPSVTVDTACSSSLVAVHQAVQSLRRGEARMAIAGGVNLMLSPELFVALSRAHMLAPDGRCKAFDASADGFARAEGCGVVVLKSLADAQADGDRVLAVLRGSAVNQDGASSSLTAPSGPAQEAVIRAALEDAGISPDQLGYLEAHGTGTNLGDPQEMRALGNVFAGRRTPLVVGSVKTNLGHLEGAAGITGLIKLTLMLREGRIPRHLHFKTPSPHIPWSSLPIRVPAEPEAWEPLGGARYASISSFGFSGTNAHIVLEEAPQMAEGKQDEAPALLALSAASREALGTLAARHAARLSEPQVPALDDVCRTANVGRAQLAYRATVSGTTPGDLLPGLEKLASGEAPVAGPVRDTPRIAFLFTGQGAQFAGMGRELYDRAPVFRAVLDRAAQRLEGRLETPLLDVMFGAPGTEGLLDRTRYTQPALFAFEYALAELWASWGVEADIVIGHSVGEFAAACLAGVMRFEDALDLVAERGRLMDELPEGGAMLSVAAPEDAVRALLGDEADVAAVNAPDQTVVSGARDALDRFAELLTDRGIDFRWLPVSHAFHSRLVDPALDAFEATASGISFGAPNRRLISNLTGRSVGAETIGRPAYWRRHMRDPVRYAEGAAEIARLGATVLVEIGPQPVLTTLARETLAVEGTGDGMAFLASFRRGRGEWEQMQAALGALWTSGVRVDWHEVERLRGGQVTDLPTYPFARDRHWIAPRAEAQGAPAPTGLSGAPLPVALGGVEIRAGEISVASSDWAGDHVVNGGVILPGAAFLSMMAAAQAGALEDVVFEAPLSLPKGERGTALQTIRHDDRIEVFSRADGEDDWTRHATARSAEAQPIETPAGPRHGREINPEGFYEGLAARGIGLGPAFRVIQRLQAAEDMAFGDIALPEAIRAEPGLPIHPLLLDGCLQLIAATGAARETGGGAFLPFAIDRAQIGSDPGRKTRARVSVRRAGADILAADIRAEAEDGTPVLALTGLRLRRLSTQPALTAAGRPLSEALYVTDRVARPVFPTPAELVDAATLHSAALADHAGLAAYDRFAEGMDAACVEILRDCFAKLGWQPEPGAHFDAETLADEFGISTAHRRLFTRLLGILAEAGDIHHEGAGWTVQHRPEPRQVAGELRQLAPRAALPEVEMLLRAGAGLQDALRGRTDALELLFPGGDTSTAEELYGAVPTSTYFNGLIAEILASLAASNRPLRILEIGGGTGGTTARVLERLPEGVDYTFTDVGPSFVDRARERFGDRDGMRFQVLDLERDLVSQGIEAGSVDVVIGANVVHATRDLAATLGRISDVMAPGGRLVLLEVTTPQRWFDLTVGLTPGWWLYSDTDLRSEGPLLDRERWLDVLRSAGFSAPAALDGDPAMPGSRGRQAVLVAEHLGTCGQHWLIVPGGDNLARPLAEALWAVGEQAEVLEGHLSAVTGAAPDQVVILGGSEDLSAAERVANALEAVQEAAKAQPAARLTLITQGAEPVEGRHDTPRAGEAGVAGLARSVALELPDVSCRRIELAPGSADVDAIAAVLLDGGDEPEVILHGATPEVTRLQPWTAPAAPEVPQEPWGLEATLPGTLEHLECRPRARRAPGPGEIEIEVEVAGLNFRDVLNALGEYPGAPPLGGECAGRVVAVGDGVTGLAPGDAVIGMVPGALGSHVTLPAALATPLPEGFDMVDGAAFAIPFVTADYCLRELGDIGPGDRVLIHAAAGGVGMAAVQIAHAAGAEVFATAGSDEKRDVVRGLGVATVMDSRTPAFLEEVVQATGGKGVDLVLNSLTGEMAEASLRALAEGGRMIELGVRDLRDPSEIEGLAPGVQHIPVNWGHVAEADPERIGAILRRVTRELSAGRLAPLPRQCFAIDEVDAAFRLMARGGHVGKIVIALRNRPKVAVRASGTYIVTGGFTGLGLDTVERLAGEGTGRIVVIGRRPPGPETEAILQGLRASGTRIDAEIVDVADAEAMTALLARIRQDGPPIRGVIHAAGTLSDAGLMAQDRETIGAVMAAKVTGTLLLERLTRADPLDLFCAYSSLAAVLGSPAQANHAAANAALGAIMRRRAAQGRPGLAIAWGPWSGIGAAAGADTIERLADQGVGALSPAEGRAACAYLMGEARGEVIVAPVNWTKLNTWRGGRPNPVFPTGERAAAPERPQTGGTAPATQTEAQDDILERLAAAEPARKRQVLDAFLEVTVRKSFALPEGRRLDPKTPFGELGLDSLLAIELRNRLGRSLGMRLPATLLFENPTLATLGDFLMSEIAPAATPVPPESTRKTAPSSDVFAGLDTLSDEELERMLGLEDTMNDEAEA